MDRFERLELLIGDKLELIKKKKVMVVGIGGVGGYVVESLVRNGIENITIVDSDIVDITNINRQIVATDKTIGRYKTEAFKDRINDINPNCLVDIKTIFVTLNNISEIFDKDYDYVVDACDTIEIKKQLIRICIDKNIKLISCMGTARKLDPSKLKIVDVRKTSYDPIAKIIRKMLKDEHINKKVMVVSSTESPKQVINSKILGSACLVPPTAGLLCASYVINDIIK